MRATFLVLLFATSCFAKDKHVVKKAEASSPYTTEKACRAAKGVWDTAGKGSCSGAKPQTAQERHEIR